MQVVWLSYRTLTHTLQLAASRYLFDQGARTGDPSLLKTASQLANDSRQNLLAAYELAQREAQARGEDEGAVLRAAQAEFQRQLREKNA